MEAEKIKTIQVTPEILEAIQNSEVLEINDKRYIEFNKVCSIVEKAVAHFKQPPVSVMPTDEEIEKEATKRINYLSKKSGWRGFIEGGKWVIDRYLSLSKEAPKEQLNVEIIESLGFKKRFNDDDCNLWDFPDYNERTKDAANRGQGFMCLANFEEKHGFWLDLQSRRTLKYKHDVLELFRGTTGVELFDLFKQRK